MKWKVGFFETRIEVAKYVFIVLKVAAVEGLEEIDRVH